MRPSNGRTTSLYMGLGTMSLTFRYWPRLCENTISLRLAGSGTVTEPLVLRIPRTASHEACATVLRMTRTAAPKVVA